jgi:DNA-binding helix-hairpin-helix protein with protein kinase domain
MAPTTLYNSLGEPIPLGRMMTSGGEGTIYEVVGMPTRLAKVYHPPQQTQERAEKLRSMERLPDPDLRKFTAWPLSLLHDRQGGKVVGFLMPRVDGKLIHTLYSPADRKRTFPTADWSFLIHTAMNCALAFDSLHGKGHVMGDVNQLNIIVANDATVTLIDCDSFQVQAKGRLFLCKVGVPEYTPPELQGRSFEGLQRTPNHDRFGLAVMIFYLLFMGRHPFAGRFRGRGDMPLEKAIKECRFVYRKSMAGNYAPPPQSLPLETLTRDLECLFERAFAQSASQPPSRPAAREWATSLANFEKRLKPCTVLESHKVPSHLSRCPWCALMAEGAPDFFVSVTVYQSASGLRTTGFSIEAVWCEIERVPLPSSALHTGFAIQPIPLPPGVPNQEPVKVRVPQTDFQKIVGQFSIVSLLIYIAAMVLTSGQVLLAIVAIFGCGTFWVWLEWMRQKKESQQNSDYERDYQAYQFHREMRQQALGQAKQDFAQAHIQQAILLVKRYDSEFISKKELLKGLRSQYAQLKPAYDADLEGLRKGRESSQR